MWYFVSEGFFLFEGFMPYPNDSAWAVKYADPRSSVRMLVSLPYEMLRDVQALAKMRGISTSELVRRCVTKELKKKKP